MATLTAKYLSLKRKYNQKEEENLSLREQIREYECNRCSSNNGINQVLLSRLECERDTAKADCVRLREENNALRADAQRVKDCQQEHVDQMKQDYDRCVAQWEVERRSLTSEISRLSEDLRLFRERLREAQTEASELRTRSNHHKMLVEQNERELRTTQDLLSQSEAELASALDRIGQLTDDCQRLEWEAKELRQERTCLKANLTRLDQDKDALLLKVDEKTEQLVRFDGELEARDKRIATLEAFIADLQKKLDVALDTAARVEHSGRQHSHDSDRLKTELDKMEKCRDAAARENSRLQDDLAAVSAEFKQTTRSLEASRREAEDLKVQLQGYVAEVRRVTNVMEEKETERMALLEQYRSLTAESANLETNNHSLESEANSTRRRLRDAQTKVTDLEAALAEKGALVHGYERQIKELTTQVAKLERKLESRTRAESANRELSRELETQKHCISQRMDQLADDNKQLEHEVCSLRDQLTKERKASVTLENVLASSRQETMQRARDNSQLTAQVACLQAKLRDLQDKLEHGTDALRRCQSECSEYQTQVAQLRMDVAERDPDRRSRAPVKCRRRRRIFRSRSLTTTAVRPMAPSPSHVCPCCFLNHISILRNTPDQSTELIQVASGEEPTSGHRRRCSQEIPMKRVTTNISVDSNPSDQLIVSDDSSEFMLPERLVEEKAVKSSDTFVVIASANGSRMKSSVDNSIDRSVLAHRISLVLKEQKRFLEGLNVSLCDEGRIQLDLDGDSDFESGSTGDSEKVVRHDRTQKNRVVSFASGDQVNVARTKTDKRTRKMSKKPIIFFNEEPIKLSKFGGQESKELISLNDANVKMLFFPDNVIKGSSSSVEDGMDACSVDSGSNSSAYVTAVNSRSDAFSRALFAAADQVCRVESREVFEIE